MSPSWKLRILALGLIVAVLVVDQATKQWVLANLAGPGASLTLPGPVDLILVLNRSNAFGLVPVAGEWSRWGLAAAGLVVSVLLVGAILWRSPSRLAMIGFAFIAAGATGNALDRIRFGAVIDFFDASKIGFVWVFNVADAAIDIGIGLVILDALLSRRAVRAG